MLKGILVIVLALLVGGYLLYERYHPSNSFGSGEVTVRSAPTSDPRERPDAFATNLDGNPANEALPTPSRSDAPGTINGDPVGNSNTGTMRAPESTSPAPRNGALSTSRTAVPVSDSIAPNPPNGTIFAGTGTYTWYRQGNLTWRVNSANGQACIAFATMEEWRKPIVYNSGCGRMI